MMYKLKIKETNQEIGIINEKQLQFLKDQLEEESRDDKDYWLHLSLLDSFRKNGADIELISILERAFGANNEIEIFWEKA
jgi:hypothetical protein